VVCFESCSARLTARPFFFGKIVSGSAAAADALHSCAKLPFFAHVLKLFAPSSNFSSTTTFSWSSLASGGGAGYGCTPWMRATEGARALLARAQSVASVLLHLKIV